MMFSFKSKTPEQPEAPPPSDVELIRAKIAACHAEIAQAEAELHAISLAAALSDDPDAGKEVLAKLTALRARKDLLSDALRAAQEIEQANADRLSEREFQARRRSLAQKIGQLGRDTEALTKALLFAIASGTSAPRLATSPIFCRRVYKSTAQASDGCSGQAIFGS